MTKIQLRRVTELQDNEWTVATEVLATGRILVNGQHGDRAAVVGSIGKRGALDLTFYRYSYMSTEQRPCVSVTGWHGNLRV